MSIQQDLRSERVGRLDLSDYVAGESGTKVIDVLHRMRDQRHNCALVTRNGRLIGVFTERDVLRKVVDAPETWDQPVDRFMTPGPQTARPEDNLGRALDLMNAGHYRNMPVVDDEGRVLGDLTQSGVIKFLSDRFPQEVYNLSPEPEQVAKARDGA